MKRIGILLSIVGFFLFSGMSCEKDDQEEEQTQEELLHVRFTNGDASEYTIMVLETRAYGKAGEMDPSPTGDWTANILPSGTQLNPGEMIEMDLAIPNSHFRIYRLGVKDGDGNLVMLHEQAGYAEDSEPTITHWGSHSREVSVTVRYNSNTGLIYTQGWGDNAY